MREALDLRTLVIPLLLLFPVLLFAQDDVSVSASNLLRYGSGRDGSLDRKRDYFENLTDARVMLHDFVVGFRFLYDAPPEYGVEFTGLRKRFVEFRRDNLSVRAGDSYSLFGRGLALNLFENRALSFDTGIDGLKMEYKTRLLKFMATAGDIRYVDVLDVSRAEKYSVRAGSLELVPYSFLSLGVSFVSGKFRVDRQFLDQAAQFDMPEYFVKVQLDNVDVFASYAEKRTTVFEPDPIFGRMPTHRGSGFYGSVAYSGESFGVSLEYKDYRFGIADPYDRNNPNRATKAFAFQNPPIVHKEHTFTLLSRYPHVIDFNDEVGFQVDVFYTLFGQLTGSLNGAAASRHYAFEPTGALSPIFLPVYGSVARTTSFLPSFDSKYSPFWEVYADWQYYFEEGGSDYALVGVNRRYDGFVDEILYSPEYGPKISATRTTSIPVSVQMTLGDDWGVKFTSERQWVNDEKSAGESEFYNQLFSLGVSKSPEYSLTLRYEFTTDQATVDGRKNWTALDLGYRLSQSHNITLTIGGDRGGQVCANGVCRVVSPFLGFRASVVSYL